MHWVGGMRHWGATEVARGSRLLGTPNFSCRRSHLNFFNCISSTVFLYEKWETSEQ